MPQTFSVAIAGSQPLVEYLRIQPGRLGGFRARRDSQGSEIAGQLGDSRYSARGFLAGRTMFRDAGLLGLLCSRPSDWLDRAKDVRSSARGALGSAGFGGVLGRRPAGAAQRRGCGGGTRLRTSSTPRIRRRSSQPDLVSNSSGGVMGHARRKEFSIRRK